MDSKVTKQGAALKKIVGVRIPQKPPSSLWDIGIEDGKISAVTPHSAKAVVQDSLEVLDGAQRLVAPSLCHAHIHLDKCFLLQDPKYEDLQIERGSFQEAMELTSQAKSRFTREDLLRRGRQLITESIGYGVTAMRAFVEVDGIVEFKCLDAGLQLKREFEDQCHVQLCAFAQLPLFSGEDDGAKVRELMAVAARNEYVDVIGSTPYTEDDKEKSIADVRWIIELALKHNKQLDLHLDYFLEEHKHPLIWDVLRCLEDLGWASRGGNSISLGHCTRLTRFRADEWRQLSSSIGQLPISFVGLPTSDLFIMRTSENLRGTLPIIEMIRDYQLNAAIAVNNVGNAFTPQGSCDPLSVATLGVGLYQAGTKQDTETLYDAVSYRAKLAIGCDPLALDLTIGQPADLVLFDGTDRGWRCRRSVSEVVYDAGTIRQTVYQGRLTDISIQ